MSTKEQLSQQIDVVTAQLRFAEIQVEDLEIELESLHEQYNELVVDYGLTDEQRAIKDRECEDCG